MSATVVRLTGRKEGVQDETILEFVAREKAVSTYSVGCRFGLYITDARKQLKRLEAEGLVQSRREIFDYCAMYGWSVTEKGKLRLEDSGKGNA